MPTHELFLLRHAKSDWDQACSDFERPLNARGVRDAAKVSQWLHDQDFHADVIYSSPAHRAAQTTQALCRGIGIATDDVVWDEHLYLAPLETLLKFIAGIPATRHSVMLIGHNPGLEDLLQYLTRDAAQYEKRGKLLTTATLAHLEFKGNWAHIEQHSAKLVQFVRPRDLSEASDT